MVAAARHTPTQREWIVRRLAAFDTPRDVAAAFVARFTDTACTEMDVLASDPRVSVVPPELVVLFQEERKRVLSDPSEAPYAEQAARLVVLSRQVDRYERNNQPDSARAVLRQIADELGIGAKGGGPGRPEDKTPEVKSITVKRTVVHPVTAAAT